MNMILFYSVNLIHNKRLSEDTIVLFCKSDIQQETNLKRRPGYCFVLFYFWLPTIGYKERPMVLFYSINLIPNCRLSEEIPMIMFYPVSLISNKILFEKMTMILFYSADLPPTNNFMKWPCYGFILQIWQPDTDFLKLHRIDCFILQIWLPRIDYLKKTKTGIIFILSVWGFVLLSANKEPDNNGHESIFW